MLLAAILPVRSMPEFVEHPGARPQVRSQTLHQPRNVEENVSSAVVRAQETEAFGFEIGDHDPRLLAGRNFARASPLSAAGLAGRLVLSPTPCLIKARSASVHSVAGFVSAGILRSGLRFRASSNNRFWRAFNRKVPR